LEWNGAFQLGHLKGVERAEHQALARFCPDARP
jgi:hypothetical protein